jgi:hypothetical protein
MEIEITVTLMPKDWFEENAHIDSDGDYWETEMDEQEFRFGNSVDTIKRAGFIYRTEPQGLERDYRITPDLVQKYAWAIEETAETHPQYFI